MKGGLVELPAGTEDHGNYRAMLRAADHGKPLVTAVSGFASPDREPHRGGRAQERRSPTSSSTSSRSSRRPTSSCATRGSRRSSRGPHRRVARARPRVGAAPLREALRRPREERPLRRREERAGREGARSAAVDAGRRPSHALALYARTRPCSGSIDEPAEGAVRDGAPHGVAAGRGFPARTST